jgi:hypothetical protein
MTVEYRRERRGRLVRARHRLDPGGREDPANQFGAMTEKGYAGTHWLCRLVSVIMLHL